MLRGEGVERQKRLHAMPGYSATGLLLWPSPFGAPPPLPPPPDEGSSRSEMCDVLLDMAGRAHEIIGKKPG
jgi:hypothetical protein